MATGTERTINLRFKMTDDGSIVLDKVTNKLAQIPDHVSAMDKALNLIKFDSLINIGKKAYAAAQQFSALAEAGAKVKSIEDSFAIAAGNAGISVDRLISSLMAATKGTIETSDMMIKATRLISEGFSRDQIVQIGEAARVSARLMGIGVTEAYDQIADSIVNLREKGLKSAGIVVDMDVAYRKHAETLNVGKEDLNQYGKQMALVNAVAEKAAELHDKLGMSVEMAYEKMQQSKATLKEFGDNLGKAASEAWELTNAMIKYAATAGMGKISPAAWGGEVPTVEGPEAEVELANRAARAATLAKSQIDETAILKRHVEDLKRIREVNLQLLKDEESTLKRMIDLQEKLNKSNDEAIKIMEQLGVGTKASLTQWIEQDIVGEYSKLLGSKLFNPDELEAAKGKYIEALRSAMSTGGWGGEFRQIEEAINKISTMKIDDTELQKARNEFAGLQKYMEYLNTFTASIKLDDEQLVTARNQIEGLRQQMIELTSQRWRINFEMTGTGSTQKPIMDKIDEIWGGFENMQNYIANMKAQVEMSEINAQIARLTEMMNAAAGAPYRGPGGGEMYTRSWAPIYQSQINALEEERRLLAGAQAAYAAPAAVSSAGGGGVGEVSININTIIVQGGDGTVAEELDDELANLWYNNTSKLKSAIKKEILP